MVVKLTKALSPKNNVNIVEFLQVISRKKNVHVVESVGVTGPAEAPPEFEKHARDVQELKFNRLWRGSH